MKPSLLTALSRLPLTLLLALPCTADLITFNAMTADENEAIRQDWLNQIQIVDPQFSIDFEDSFSDGQDIAKEPLSGGLKMTSEDSSIIITNNSGLLGSSQPVGILSASFAENTLVTLDFSANPVAYVSFVEIDTLGATYTITLDDDESIVVKGETTASSGESAEFVGFYSDDNRKITQITMTSEVGDNEWGIDSLLFGNVQVLYVDGNTSATANGSSWANAFHTLQDALAVATPPTSVLIAEGLYFPDKGSGQTEDNVFSTFAPPLGTSLFGGFPQGGALFSERNAETNQTILSGRLRFMTLPGEELFAQHVISIIEPDEPGYLRIEDLTIRDGNASGAFQDAEGGGILVKSQPQVGNVSLFLTRCVIEDNQADAGAGIFLRNPAHSEFIDCIFRRNSTSSFSGGAVSFFSLETTTDLTAPHSITRCLFSGNSADSSAGAIATNWTELEFHECIFTGNTAMNSGSVLWARNSSLGFNNCTISGNRGGPLGGAALNNGTLLLGPSDIRLNNCIIWNNAQGNSTTSPAASLAGFPGRFTATNSLIQNWRRSSGLLGTGNLDGTRLDKDPRFFNPLSPTAAPTTKGDYRLTAGSSAIDAGATMPVELVESLSETDFRGRTRILDGDDDGEAVVDLGAVEYLFGTLRGSAKILSFVFTEKDIENFSLDFDMTVQGEAGQDYILQRATFSRGFTTDLQFRDIGSVRTFTGNEDRIQVSAFDDLSETFFFRIQLTE